MRILQACLALLLAAPLAEAFCGFYVAKEPGDLVNEASKVVLVRNGEDIVLTMSSDYRGAPEQFGLVVPVPVPIEPGMVAVSEQKFIDSLDRYSVPRLAAYNDPDPCPPRMMAVGSGVYGSGVGYGGLGTRGSGAGAGGGYGVTVRQAFALEEYEVTVIEATEATGLEAWLVKEGYHLPDGAVSVLDSYIRQGMYFFLAKIDTSAQKELGIAWPRPLRLTYRSPKFMLPLRLGTVNAKGPQDLLVFAITERGRVETTNYRTVRVPSDIEIPAYIEEGANFGLFYQRLFDRQVRRNGGNAVFTEYAWPLTQKCDPCSGPLPDPKALAGVGASPRGFLTRLHVRYDAAHFPEDLVFQETADRATFQARYVLNRPFRGNTSCRAGQAYVSELEARQQREVDNLAGLTGWRAQDIRAFVK